MKILWGEQFLTNYIKSASIPPLTPMPKGDDLSGRPCYMGATITLDSNGNVNTTTQADCHWGLKGFTGGMIALFYDSRGVLIQNSSPVFVQVDGTVTPGGTSSRSVKVSFQVDPTIYFQTNTLSIKLFHSGSTRFWDDINTVQSWLWKPVGCILEILGGGNCDDTPDPQDPQNQQNPFTSPSGDSDVGQYQSGLIAASNPVLPESMLKDGTIITEYISQTNKPTWVIYNKIKIQVPDKETRKRMFPNVRPMVLWNGALDNISTNPNDNTLFQYEDGSMWIILGGVRFPGPDSATASIWFKNVPIYKLWNGALDNIPTTPKTSDVMCFATLAPTGTFCTIIGRAKFCTTNYTYSNGVYTVDSETATGRFPGATLYNCPWQGVLNYIGFVPDDGTKLQNNGGGNLIILKGMIKIDSTPGVTGTLPRLWIGAFDHIVTMRGTIRGLVTGPYGPIPEANVGWSSPTLDLGLQDFESGMAKTDSSGECSITAVSGGVCIIQITAPWFKTYNDKITVPDESMNYTFSLNRIPHGTLTGTVKDVNGNSITDASVSAATQALPPSGDTNWELLPLSTTTDQSGYTINLYPNTYTIAVSKSGFDIGQTVVTIVDNSTCNCPIVLHKFGILTGYVKDINGNPINGAIVIVNPTSQALPIDDELSLKSPTTDTSGKYSINLGANTYYVIVFKPGFDSGDAINITIADEKTLSHYFILTNSTVSGTLIGKVTDDSGSPVEGATVSASTTTSTAVTKQDGTYMLSNVSSGWTMVWASKAPVGATHYVESPQKYVRVIGNQSTSLNMILKVEFRPPPCNGAEPHSCTGSGPRPPTCHRPF